MKCSWSKGVRYCGKECQDRSSEQHKGKCQELKEISRRQQESYSHVAKELFPCPALLNRVLKSRMDFSATGLVH